MVIEQATVIGGQGARLWAGATAPREGPVVLLLHGFAQTSDVWQGLMSGDLASELRMVCVDLRGHGRSTKRVGDSDDPRVWAADIAAVCQAFDLWRPIVVAWSYAGLVLCDYLRVHGDGQLGACAFVAAATRINDGSVTTIGKEMLHVSRDLLAEDRERRAAADVHFARRMTNAPMSALELQMAIEQVQSVPLAGRRRLLTRRALNDDVLQRLDLPTLVAQGDGDPFVLPVMSELTAGLVPGARLSVYEGCGHALFAEDQPRFESELLELANACG